MADVVVSPFRVLSICAGAGGLDLGLQIAEPSARTVCYVEHEAAAILQLVTRLEEGWLDPAPVWSDLRTFRGRAWRGAVDCVMGGIPCQPHSVAGKRLGPDDARDLWPDTARVVRECEPEWVFIENVPGVLPYLFHAVLPELSAMGYRAEAFLCEAADLGAPHRRERVFILAHRAGDGVGQGGEQPARQLAAPPGSGTVANADGRHRGRARGAISAGRATTNASCEPVADANREGRPSTLPDAQESQPNTYGAGLFPPGPGDLDRWQRILTERPSLTPATEAEPAVRGVADGLADRLDLSRPARLRLTGNGVVPLQAAFAWRTLRGRFLA